MIVQAEALDHIAQVALDLIAGREESGPVRFRGERELVQLRGHVTRETRVAIPVPHPADVRSLLKDREIVKTRTLQRHCCCDTRDAGADDDDPRIAVRHCSAFRAWVPTASS